MYGTLWGMDSTPRRRGNSKLTPKAAVKSASKAAAKSAPKSAPKAKPTRKSKPRPKLLSGGNPQIAKADGDAPVQAYIAAMPGWKRDLGRQLDALIMQAVPGACKAVKWNSPLYGIEGQGWFLGIHCFTKYLKVAFFQGVSLKPLPPVESKDKNTRYFHIYEGEKLDTAQFASWAKQASKLPGWGKT